MVNIHLVKYISDVHLELETEFHYEKSTYRGFFFVFFHRISITNSKIALTDGEICNSKRQKMIAYRLSSTE